MMKELFKEQAPPAGKFNRESAWIGADGCNWV